MSRGNKPSIPYSKSLLSAWCLFAIGVMALSLFGIGTRAYAQAPNICKHTVTPVGENTFHLYENCLDFTFGSGEVKVGDTVQTTIQIKSQGPSLGSRFGYSFFVCAQGSTLTNCKSPKQVANGDSSGNNSVTFRLLISSQNFSVGKNIVSAEFLMSTPPETYTVSGAAEVEVKPSTGTGPSVTAVESKSYFAGGGKIAKVFTINYLDGGSGETKVTFAVSCGEGGELVQTKPDALEFECHYPLVKENEPPKTYHGTIQAKNPQGKVVASNTFDVKVSYGEGTGGMPQGANLLDVGGGTVLSIVNMILGTLFAIIRWIIWALGNFIFVPLLDTTLNLEAGDIAGGVIMSGWTLVRDVVNMFFILALIVIGFGTMLRIENYSYKKLLVSLILMALLVNFSLVIGRIIIQIADTVQFTFLPAKVSVQGDPKQGITGVRYLFKTMVTVHPSSILEGIKSWTISSSSALATTFTLFFQLILELGVILTFGAMAIFMLIRTIALWILLIISPMAYAMNILPATKSYASKWWSTFIKYALFAPILAFFLKLTLVLYQKGLNIIPFDKMSYSSGQTAGSKDLFDYLGQLNQSVGGITFERSLELAMVYVVILAFMWAGMIVAKQMGIFGANAIVGLAEKGLKAPFALAGRGLKTGGGALVGFAGRAYSGWTTRKMTAAQESGKKGQAAFWRVAQFANLRVAREAWKARSELKEKEAYLPAVGHVRDSLNRILPTEWHRDKEGKLRLGQKSYYGRIGQRELINFKTKQWEEAHLSEEEKVKAYNGVHNAEDKEALDTVLMLNRHEDGRAIMTALEKRRKREDELTKQFISQGETSDVARAKASVQAEAEIPAQYDAVDDLDTVTEDLKRAGLTGEQIGAIQAHRDEVAEAERKIRGIGNSVYEYDGNFRAANDMSGYEKMEKELGKTEMLKSLKETGVFKVREEPLLDKDGKAVLDEKGNAIKVPVELDFQGQKITDYKSFAKAIEDTHEVKDVQGNVVSGSKANGENLKYELTGARKQRSAQKRMERGDTELWGAAIEPAAYMVQEEDGNFSRFTSYGQRSYKNLSTLVVNSFRKGRRLQARAAKIAGLKKDEQTGQIEVGATDYKVMAEAFTLNNDMTNAIVEKAELEKETVEKMKDELQKHLKAGLKAETVEGAAGKFSISVTKV